MSHRVKGSKAWWMSPLLFLSLASLAATGSDLQLVEAVEKGNRDVVRSGRRDHGTALGGPPG
jgi:hypothetical protein